MVYLIFQETWGDSNKYPEHMLYEEKIYIQPFLTYLSTVFKDYL